MPRSRMDLRDSMADMAPWRIFTFSTIRTIVSAMPLPNRPANLYH